MYFLPRDKYGLEQGILFTLEVSNGINKEGGNVFYARGKQMFIYHSEGQLTFIL